MMKRTLWAVALAASLLSLNAASAQEADTNELCQRVWGLLDRLSLNQREVIRLKFQHDCSYQEIAEITGLTTGNVGFLMHVAIKKLRELLGNELSQHALN